ncbi:phthiocerol/phthiodiolone dimycocerosyl transferase family protein [Nostoc sp. FACHB-110]|uniref:phthiocerol/phthiodiolone dimycocerosyl transferase family protein n=1 Tax=Nostoc sp. FACHB-110 TaxID=2692834 RepID=UPI001685276D|nr:condensation domain-containing protein [Nostoc sp. FACHB-110]MBD2437825.1 alcohol acetyltransferase [Nostoc sp. FACHB-110]
MAVNRQLTPIEEGLEIINQTGGSFNVVTISRIIGCLDEEILRKALAIVQLRHPLLNARIVNSLNRLCFEAGAIQIPLRSVHSQHWQEVVIAEMNEKIASDAVLARCILVKSPSDNQINYLITILHHAISDGLSSVQLHSELLTYCQKITDGELVNSVESLPVLPPIAELLPESMQGWRGKIKGIFSLLNLQFKHLWYRPKALKFEQCVPIESRRCGLVHRQLDKELTEKLVDFCRQEKTTVQGALCAALMFAAANQISGYERKDVCLSCWSYVNLRQRLRSLVSENNLNVLISSITSFHTLNSKTTFWDLAREVRQNLIAGLNSDNLFSIIMMYKQVIKFLLTQPNHAPASVSVTNIGKVKIPKFYGQLELEQISFLPAQGVFGGVVSLAVSTFDSKMNLNFTFSLPAISQNSMEKLADNLVVCLKNACDF